jgi:hypothetical protein
MAAEESVIVRLVISALPRFTARYNSVNRATRQEKTLLISICVPRAATNPPLNRAACGAAASFDLNRPVNIAILINYRIVPLARIYRVEALDQDGQYPTNRHMAYGGSCCVAFPGPPSPRSGGSAGGGTGWRRTDEQWVKPGAGS